MKTQNEMAAQTPYAPDEEAQAYNNSFFDASTLNGWLRCEASERFAIRYINDYMVRLLGFDDSEALMAFCDGSLAALMPDKDDCKRIADEAARLPAAGNMALSYRLRTRTGGEVWVRECSHKYIDADGTPMLLCLCVDITGQKRAEDALEQTSGELIRQRRYQEILDALLPVGTVLISLDGVGTLLHVGGTMLTELGYTKEEYGTLQKRHLRGLVLEEDYGRRFTDRMQGDGPYAQSFEQEFRVVKKDGGVRWLYEKGTLVTVDGGPAYIVVCIDVTRRKEMEEQLRIGREESAVVMAQMGKMICLFDVATRTLTMPEAYAKKHGLPSVLSDVPKSVAERGIPEADGDGAAFCAFYEAIIRGERTGSVEVRLRCADGTHCCERGEFVTIFGLDGEPVKAVVAVEDITLARLREDENEALRESERVFRMVAAHSNRRIYRYDIASKTIYADIGIDGAASASARMENMPESAIENGMVLTESIDDVRQMFAEMHAGKPEGDAKLHVRIDGGAPRWVDVRYSLVRSGEHAPMTAVLSLQDITAAHERELAYARYRQTVGDGASDGSVIYFETDLTASVVEKQGGNIPGLAFPESGCRHEDAVHYGIENLVTEEGRARASAFFSREHLITAFSDGTRNLSADLPVNYPKGKLSWFRADVQMVRDPYSDHIKAYTMLRDVTAEKLAALDVKKQAETDGMTGLYNKSTTEALVREKLQDADGRPCALLIVDLDSLKSINDNLGHAQGDRAIKQMADAIRAQFRQTDVVGRIGGDEFLAFLPGIGDEARLSSMLTALMRKLSKQRIGERDDRELRGSIGVTVGVTGRDDFEELYRRADKALYYVKRNGKNDFAFYTPEMEGDAYCYKGHEEESVWQADAFDRAELDRLLYAVTTVYPLVISVNLTQNSYYMMQYNHFTTAACSDAGEFDKLIADGMQTFHPEDRQAFFAAFNRESLLAAHARGQRIVSHTGRQLGDDGRYRRICTDVIFAQDTPQGDVMEITLAREVDLGPDGE